MKIAQQVNYKVALFFFLASLSIAFYLIKQTSNLPPIYCKGEINIHRDDLIANVILSFNIYDTHGSAIIMGSLIQGEKKIGYIDRNIYFGIERNGGDFFLKSKNITLSTSETLDEAMIRHMLPGFLSKENNSGYLSILQTDNNDYIIYINKMVPYIMCKNTHNK